MRLFLLLLALVLLLSVAAASRRRVPRSQLDEEEGDEDDAGRDSDPSPDAEDDETAALPMSITDYLRPPTATKVSLRDRGLLSSNLLSSSVVLDQHHFYAADAERSFSKDVLGYVTPWNAKGYEVALLMKSRGQLDIVVPVWFRLVRDAKSGEVQVDGVQDMNKKWLKEMQEPDCSVEDHNAQVCQRRKVTVAPRVKVEADLRSQEDIVTAARLLHYLQDKHSLDGFTLEVNLNLMELVVQLTLVLKETYGMFVVLVLPPVEVPDAPAEAGAKMRAALAAMTRYADRVSLMSYDANQGKEGPNAPLPWVKKIVSSLVAQDAALRRKLLLGLPFYGWRSAEDMTGEKLVVWLASTAQRAGRDEGMRVAWDSEAAEHVFTEVSDAGASPARVLRRCYFPTPLFLQRRLRLAEQQGLAGVAVWELGQGLAAFTDVF